MAKFSKIAETTNGTVHYVSGRVTAVLQTLPVACRPDAGAAVRKTNGKAPTCSRCIRAVDGPNAVPGAARPVRGTQVVARVPKDRQRAVQPVASTLPASLQRPTADTRQIRMYAGAIIKAGLAAGHFGPEHADQVRQYIIDGGMDGLSAAVMTAMVKTPTVTVTHPVGKNGKRGKVVTFGDPDAIHRAQTSKGYRGRKTR